MVDAEGGGAPPPSVGGATGVSDPSTPRPSSVTSTGRKEEGKNLCFRVYINFY